MSAANNAQVAEIRRSLVDPVRIVERLGLGKGAQRQGGGGVTVRCPVHAERTPSCSVTRGRDGTIRVRCFGCQWSADVLGLVAAVHGLDTRRDFRDVLRAAAEVGGLHQLVAELAGAAPRALRAVPPLPEPTPEREYPPLDEVRALWAAAAPVATVEAAGVMLALRGLHPGPELARGLPDGTTGLPRWASYRGKSWVESGHRVLLPVYDAAGEMRSLRAWQVKLDAPPPKRLPPAGHRATELVLANPLAVAMLREPSAPVRLLVAEGEPDALSLCERYPGVAVIGVVSGSWTEAFASRVPLGSLVTIRTHHDEAGGRYAEAVAKTLTGRAIVRRAA